jgi:hypothetical protein
MKKSETLKQWRTLEPSNPLQFMVPVPYKARGSRYGACGVRIDGNPQFVEAVLSKLKELIDGENHLTRLELARHVVDGSGIGKELPNADSKAEVCYIRLHERGRDGQIASAIFDRDLAPATERFGAL